MSEHDSVMQLHHRLDALTAFVAGCVCPFPRTRCPNCEHVCVQCYPVVAVPPEPPEPVRPDTLSPRERDAQLAAHIGRHEDCWHCGQIDELAKGSWLPYWTWQAQTKKRLAAEPPKPVEPHCYEKCPPGTCRYADQCALDGMGRT